MLNIFTFKPKSSIWTLGDIHGAFQVIESYLADLTDATIIQVGDFGVFNSEDMKRLETLDEHLAHANCQLLVIRGNHDNPAFFQPNATPQFQNIYFIPDYSLVDFVAEGSDTPQVRFLMIGGGISIDRQERLVDYDYFRDEGVQKPDAIFWASLQHQCANFPVQYLITHVSPNGLSPHGPGTIIENFAFRLKDATLVQDVAQERAILGEVLEFFTQEEHEIQWIYGHYHRSENSGNRNIWGRMLGINELKRIFE